MFQHSNDHDAFIFEGLPAIEHDDNLLEQLLAECSVLPGDVTNSRLLNVQCYQATLPTSDDHQGGSKRKGRGKLMVADDRETKCDQGNSSTTNTNKELKKAMHRDIERQRRQEMSGLFCSLRSLLPLEYIKGKRSTSDHMNEAVKYINHMQAKLEGMRNQRDRLKNASTSSSSHEKVVSIISDSTGFVKVKHFGDEIEILISSGLACEAFPLSTVLKELLGRGHNVVSCVSSRVDQRSLHKIQFEDNDCCLDLLELQKNLEDLIRLA